jgi:type II secretory pathway pseudopilin PulG
MSPSRAFFNTCSRGFTLAEIVIANAVLVVAAGAIFSVFFQSQHSLESQKDILEVTQQARAAMLQVSSYLRQAGNDPQGYLRDNDIPPIELLGTNYIRINSDITGAVPAASADPLDATGNPDGTLDNLYEQVEVLYNASQERLYLNIGYGADVVAENLSFDFTFLDINGNETANEDDIVRVHIEVVAETEDLNPLTEEVQSITLQSEVMLRSRSFDVFAN